MKKLLYSTFLLFLITICGCSTTKVLNSWKSPNASTLKDSKIFVIARTNNKAARTAFEKEITDQLNKEGYNAVQSAAVLSPDLDIEKKFTQEQQQDLKNFLNNEGYNAIVISIIKDYQETSKTVTDGGYYAGATMPLYYPSYYGGFYGYYVHPLAYSTYGNYVAPTSTTYINKVYVLETLAYNLELDHDNQLVAVVTSKFENPENIHTNAVEYVKQITNALK